MLQKIKAFLRNWIIESEYNEHLKRMKEIETQQEKIMQEIIDLEKSMEETQNTVIELFSSSSSPIRKTSPSVISHESCSGGQQQLVINPEDVTKRHFS